MSRLGFHFGEWVVALGFQDQVARLASGQADDEVGEEFVRFAVVEVRDREAETGVLDERVHPIMGIQAIGGGLLPLGGVG